MAHIISPSVGSPSSIILNDEPSTVKTTPELPRTPTKIRMNPSAPSSVSPASQRVTEIFKRVPMPSPEAIEKAKTARNMQRMLAETGLSNEATELPITATTHCYVTRENLFLTKERAGKGTASEAWFTDAINPTTTDAPKSVVLKRSRGTQLEQEHNLTKQIQLSSPSKRRRLNFVESMYEIPMQNVHIGIYEACKSNLNGLKYSPNTPASQVLPILRDIAEGLCELSNQGIAHCDIKGDNLLVTQENGGSIGDFGLGRRKAQQRHPTSITPIYAAPFIWENILDQKYRRNGYQGQAADVFALGVTLQFDVFGKMLPQLASHYKVDIKQKMEAIQPVTENVASLSDQDLLDLQKREAKHFQRILYSGRNPSMVIKFKPRKYVLIKILESIDLFQRHIPLEELNKMKGLAHLMHDLQDTNPRNLPASKALNGFNALINLSEKAEAEITSTIVHEPLISKDI